MTQRLSPPQIIEGFRAALGKDFVEGSVTEREMAVEKKKLRSLWITIDGKALPDAVKYIMTLEPNPHLAMITGSDRGETVELLYHFTIYFGHSLEELNLTVRFPLDKKDLTVPTVTRLVPGAVYSERELQEFLGVTVEGIPDGRRLLLDGVVPEGVHPWRRDDSELQKYLRVLPGRQPAAGEEK